MRAAFPVAFTLAIMPDTQNCTAVSVPTDFYPVFISQTTWLAAHAADWKIAAVLHEGDITNNNNVEQWTRASNGMDLLWNHNEGLPRVPYVFTVGNHDIGTYGDAMDRTTLMNGFPAFAPSRFMGIQTAGWRFGDVFEAGDMSNNYSLLTAGGRDWLLLALEFGPRNEVLTWANALCTTYAARDVIIVTHAYLYDDDTLQTMPDAYDPHGYGMGQLPGGSANDGLEMWNKLVRLHPNIRFVFNGHQIVDGLGRAIGINDAGNHVVQLLADYQQWPMGGSGYLRLLQFSQDMTRLMVWSYSPYLDHYLDDGQNQFEVDLVNWTFVEHPGVWP